MPAELEAFCAAPTTLKRAAMGVNLTYSFWRHNKVVSESVTIPHSSMGAAVTEAQATKLGDGSSGAGGGGGGGGSGGGGGGSGSVIR